MEEKNVFAKMISDTINLYESSFGPKDLRACTRLMVEKYFKPEELCNLTTQFSITKDDFINWIISHIKEEMNKDEKKS